METKHTPGPWKVYRAENGKIIGIGVDRPGDEDHAAGITDPGFGLWGGEDEKAANARLIAAAPDLYAALEGLLSLVHEGDALDPQVYAAQDALAKARGRA